MENLHHFVRLRKAVLPHTNAHNQSVATHKTH